MSILGAVFFAAKRFSSIRVRPGMQASVRKQLDAGIVNSGIKADPG
jgi:hypothetical protein